VDVFDPVYPFYDFAVVGGDVVGEVEGVAFFDCEGLVGGAEVLPAFGVVGFGWEVEVFAGAFDLFSAGLGVVWEGEGAGEEEKDGEEGEGKHEVRFFGCARLGDGGEMQVLNVCTDACCGRFVYGWNFC